MTDLYKALQIDPSADAEVVEAAYRRLARKFHPDVSERSDADQRIRELNAAYEVLGDPARRARYDLARAGRRTAAATRRRSSMRVVAPERRTAAPDVESVPIRILQRTDRVRLRRSVLVATMAGVSASVGLAVLAAQMFSAKLIDSGEAWSTAIVVVSSAREEPPAAEPAVTRPTATPSGWPPAIYVVGGVQGEASPHVDLFTRFVGAARQVTSRLQGPTPPEWPYNPAAP